MNFFDSKLPSVTKSYVDKLLSKLMKKCYRINFFKLMHSLNKFMACVNIAKLQSSISFLEMFLVCLNNARLSLLILAFAHRHATHSSILSIALFHYFPHVLISSKCQKGTSQMSSLGYSIVFFVISHILSSMLEINIYSIMHSKVFGVIICSNFFLSF